MECSAAGSVTRMVSVAGSFGSAAVLESPAGEQAAAPDVTRTRLYRDIVPDALQRAKLYVLPGDPGFDDAPSAIE